MRLPRFRLSLRGLIIAVAVAGIGMGVVSRCGPNWRYYVSGWWEAERELRQGKASIYQIGGLRMGDICNLDQDTGLPIVMVCGCVIARGDEERVQGHNDHIEQYITWHGLPENTFKPWEKELFNLKSCFDDRSRKDPPKRLIVGGPALIAPDGKSSVRPVATVKDDGSPDNGLKVVIAAGNVKLDDWYVRWFEGVSDLQWGPAGSRFAVTRSTCEKSETYMAFDLRTGRLLREETWDEGKRRVDPFANPDNPDTPPAPPDDYAESR
ncbi:MAG TPA: hypothetical protein VGZ22_19880 [Isosphaeraceae bacterium]|jgi:hypothetical protein|nr:hypothetical protein [Isosphaeraceae bacterium]